MELEPFVAGIKKTGYPLEYSTVQTLLDAGWSVISNKYYLDNDENKPREVDVLAYRCSTEHKDYDVYTVLIISCKKSQHSAWTFLTRDINVKDPNADWEPTHFWSSYKPLAFVTNTTDWPKRYHQLVTEKKVAEVLRQPTEEIFAFQEMGEVKEKERKANGDGAMFGSVLSLMKAQSYEMSSRAQKKRKKKAIYQFNLISLAQTDFVRLHFKGDQIVPSDVDSAHYIARYIINKHQTFARIFFVRSCKFAQYLSFYKDLHRANCEIAEAETKKFYVDIVRDSDRSAVFLDEFKRQLEPFVRAFAPAGVEPPAMDTLAFGWNDVSSTLILGLDIANEDVLAFLQGDVISKRTKELLKSIFRYEGKFKFDFDIPF